MQLEETQTKRHDQLVEHYNELLQEIQDLKPKVPSSRCASFLVPPQRNKPQTSLRTSQRIARRLFRAEPRAAAAAVCDFSPTQFQISADVNNERCNVPSSSHAGAAPLLVVTAESSWWHYKMYSPSATAAGDHFLVFNHKTYCLFDATSYLLNESSEK